MGSVIGAIMPLGVGVAISPVPIIAAILMLLSKRAGSSSVGFAVGWLVGIVVATTIFLLLAGTLGESGGQPSAAAAWIQLALGVLLLGLGVRNWRGRGGENETPKWMAALDDITAVKAAGLGFALAAINPKNLLMCVAAGVAIGSAGLGAGSAIVALAVFTALAACTVVVPVVGYAVAAERMRGPLDRLRGWLEENNATVMSVLVLVIGVVLIGKGIGGL